MAAAQRPESFGHGGKRIESPIGPVVPLLELFDRHVLRLENDMMQIVEVPVPSKDAIFSGELLVKTGPGERG